MTTKDYIEDAFKAIGRKFNRAHDARGRFASIGAGPTGMTRGDAYSEGVRLSQKPAKEQVTLIKNTPRRHLESISTALADYRADISKSRTDRTKADQTHGRIQKELVSRGPTAG